MHYIFFESYMFNDLSFPKLKPFKGFKSSSFSKIKQKVRPFKAIKVRFDRNVLATYTVKVLSVPKNFLVKGKNAIVQTRIYIEFDKMTGQKKLWIITFGFFLLITLVYSFPGLKRFFKRPLIKSHIDFNRRVLAYVPIDQAERNKGLCLLAGVNIIGLGFEILYDDCLIAKQIFRGARSGLSCFIVLNYKLMGHLVPPSLRETLEPAIEKMSSPWISLPASMGLTAPFWIKAFNGVLSAEEAREFLEAGLQASKEKILSLEHNQGFLEASLEESKKSILKSTKGDQILRTIISELKEKITLTEQRNAPLSAGYATARNMLLEQLQLTEGQCLRTLYRSLGKGVRRVKDFDSYIFSPEQKKFVFEAPITKLFELNCRDIYDVNQVPVVGDKIYQKVVFEKLVKLSHHFNGHAVEKAIEGLPTDPLLVGFEAIEESVVNAMVNMELPDDMYEMLEEGLRSKFGI